MLKQLFYSLSIIVATATAHAVDHAAEYRACIELARINPAEAFESARFWEQQGGGEGAKHCAAVALVGQRKFMEAASVFAEIGASQSNTPPNVKAKMMAQGAQAYMLAGQPARAIDLLNSTLLIAPNNMEYRVDRSVAHATMGNYVSSIDDLNVVLQQNPRHTDALTFRASAHRFLNQLDRAKADIDQALRLDPRKQEALLERGVVKVLAGDKAGARADWQEVLRINPNTIAANAARDNLQKLN
jgi:tetratricopeptide (TPR) repeat protein